MTEATKAKPAKRKRTPKMPGSGAVAPAVARIPPKINLETPPIVAGFDPAKSPGPFQWVPSLAANAVAFFSECLTFTSGQWRGAPFHLEPWQAAIVANLFGWVDGDRLRRFRKGLIYVPRKNGKTEIAAGLGLKLVAADNEPAAHVICAAAEREQARLLLNAAKTMVQADAALSHHCQTWQNAVTAERGSSLKAISAEAYSKHGLNLHGVLLDELHAQPNRELYDVLATAQAARRQPLFISISTADFMRPSLCNDELTFAKLVHDGTVIDHTYLPVIYETSPDDDWTTEDCWRAVNPNFGISIGEEYFRRECERARREPSYENTFRRLHLNTQTGQDERWLNVQEWDRCARPGECKLDGLPCVAGLDLASSRDMSAFCIVGKRESGVVVARFWYWATKGRAEEREKRDPENPNRPAYRAWAQQKWLELHDSEMQDQPRILRTIVEQCRRYGVREIGYDKWNSGFVAPELGNMFTLVDTPQSPKAMNVGSKMLETLIQTGSLIHDGNPVTRWMVSNVSKREDTDGNIKPDKKRSTDKIDGVVAMVLGLNRMAGASGNQARRSIYETRGVVAT